MSSKARGRSSSKGAEPRDPEERSSRAAPRFAADLDGGSPFASRRGVAAGGPAGEADGGAGAAEGGAGGADAFAEGAEAVAGGAGAVAGAAGGVADGDAAGADGIGAGAVGGAVACLDRRKIRSSTKELTDDIA